MFSQKTKEILSQVKRMVPPMLEKFHKGQLGRVAVVGGCQDYTGAPYFSAMASARLGADMSHVICEPDAAQVIKTYSPNLMVHPLLHQSSKTYPNLSQDLQSSDPKVLAEPIRDLVPRLHALVFGPGLGRDSLMLSTVREVVLACREQDTPFVMDADALMLVNQDPSLVSGYKGAILTPNVVEFGRLAKAVGVDLEKEVDMSDQVKAHDVPKGAAETAAVSNKLGGVIVVRKGRVDYISDGKTTLTCDLEGGLKRAGGQGDTLTGSIATLLAWRDAYLEGIWDIKGPKIDEHETMLLAAFGGCAITRECSRLAFKEKGRAMQASDVGDNVANAFRSVIGEYEESKL